MNCASFESLIALYVEGDLRGSDQVRVEAHLQRCARCRDLADELRESQTVFKYLRQGAVHPTALADVRQRVMSEVGGLEPAPAWVLMMHRLIFAGLRRKTAIAGVVLAVLVSGGVWYEETPAVGEFRNELPVEVARVELQPADVPPAAPQKQVVVSRPVRPVEQPSEIVETLPLADSAAQTIEPQASPESQLSQIPMKFVTDDPDIIIYWLPRDKGD